MTVNIKKIAISAAALTALALPLLSGSLAETGNSQELGWREAGRQDAEYVRRVTADICSLPPGAAAEGQRKGLPPGVDPYVLCVEQHKFDQAPSFRSRTTVEELSLSMARAGAFFPLIRDVIGVPLIVYLLVIFGVPLARRYALWLQT